MVNMSKPKPRFSIVIPCFNEGKFIGRTLESLSQQSFKDFEVIVVDNNSYDNTIQVAKSYGVKVERESRRGVCWAREAGTQAANGEIVISTDADTVFKENWLEKIDLTFRNNECIAVAGPCAYHDGPWWAKLYPKLLFGAVATYNRITGKVFYVTATNLAFKKMVWSGYDTSLTQGGDEVGLLNSLQKKGKVVFINHNPVYTSGRRLYKGMAHAIFVTFIYHYVIAYNANRWLKRPVIGMAPAYREDRPVMVRRFKLYRLALLAVLILFVSMAHIPGHDTLVQQAHETYSFVEKTIKSKI